MLISVDDFHDKAHVKVIVLPLTSICSPGRSLKKVLSSHFDSRHGCYVESFKSKTVKYLRVPSVHTSLKLLRKLGSAKCLLRVNLGAHLY